MKALKAGRPLAVWVIAVLASSSDYSFGAGFGNDFQGCAFDRPCITGIYRTKAGGIFVKWTASDDYSLAVADFAYRHELRSSHKRSEVDT